MPDEPKYNLRYDLDPELVAATLALVQKGGSAEAVKKLVESTHCHFQEAIAWIMEHQPHDPTPCPYCGAPLATSRAQQCLFCGMDWHDTNHVIRRGDPDWNRWGLKKELFYVVELCQGREGRRYTKYRDVVCSNSDLDVIFETETAPGAKFLEWGETEYARHLRLSNGELFCFDPFGYWITEKEVDYLKRRDAGQLAVGEQPPLVNGMTPWLREKRSR